MESLKKIISLKEASEFSGYTQDYLGYLIRIGEIKGIKKGKSWFTTDEEVKNYLFKKKIRSRKFAIKEFFSPTRTRNIVIATAIVFVGGYLLLTFINKKEATSVDEIKSAITSDGEAIKINY